MARTPSSNPTPTPGRNAYPGGVKGNSALKKRAGTQQRGGRTAAGTPSSGQRTTARSVTTSGGGGTGGLPRGQGAPGRQGLPPSGFQTQQGVEPIPQGDEGGYA